MKRAVITLLGFFLSISAQAHRGEYVFEVDEQNNIVYERVVAYVETDPEDVGLRGGFYIGLEDAITGHVYAHTLVDGWVPVSGSGITKAFHDAGSLRPTFSILIWETPRPKDRIIPPTPPTDYNVVDQVMLSYSRLCSAFASHGIYNANLWIGYGALQPEKANLVNNFHIHANPRLDPEHISQTYIFMDGSYNKKYSKILSFTCPPTSNIG